MALSAGAASRSCVLGAMRARMPRRRLFLAVYVCDLEFGICQALCLFIYLVSTSTDFPIKYG